MKSTFLSTVFLFSFLVINAQFDSIVTPDGLRHYKIHFPTDYDETIDYPMVIGFHGGFGNAEQFEEQSLLSEKADESNFIAVYPQGLGFTLAPNLRFWNAGLCCGYPMINNIDDVAFISNMIDSIDMEYNINLNKVYCTGISNGGFMSYKMACEKADKIAAIAPVAGGLVFNDCQPSQQVPIIHFHSYLDENIPLTGGIGNGPSTHYNPPIDSILNVWASTNECAVTSDTIYNGSDYKYIQWSNCNCDASIDLYITEDGGHSWPGGTQVLGDPVSEVINANDLLWEFFSEHSLECEDISVQESTSNPELIFYPNPSKALLKVKSINPLLSITLIDQLGRNIKLLEAENNVYNLDYLESGVYTVRVETTKGFIVKKWIKE